MKLYKTNLHTDNDFVIVFRLNEVNYQLFNSTKEFSNHSNVFPHIFMYALGMKKFIGHQGKTDKDFEMLTVKNIDNSPVNLSNVMENAMVIDDYKTFDSILNDVKKIYPEYFI